MYSPVFSRIFWLGKKDKREFLAPSWLGTTLYLAELKILKHSARMVGNCWNTWKCQHTEGVYSSRLCFSLSPPQGSLLYPETIWMLSMLKESVWSTLSTPMFLQIFLESPFCEFIVWADLIWFLLEEITGSSQNKIQENSFMSFQIR